MICPKCKSENVDIQVVVEQKKRGCLGACVWLLLAVCTCGIILLIPLLTKKGSKKSKVAVCQNCGYTWKL